MFRKKTVVCEECLLSVCPAHRGGDVPHDEVVARRDGAPRPCARCGRPAGTIEVVPAKESKRR